MSKIMHHDIIYMKIFEKCKTYLEEKLQPVSAAQIGTVRCLLLPFLTIIVAWCASS